MQPTPVFLPETFHGQKSLVGYSPCKRARHNLTTKQQQSKILETVEERRYGEIKKEWEQSRRNFANVAERDK